MRFIQDEFEDKKFNKGCEKAWKEIRKDLKTQPKSIYLTYSTGRVKNHFYEYWKEFKDE